MLKGKAGGFMNISTNAIGFTLDNDRQELIDKKLERVKYADALIVTLSLKVKLDNKQFFFEANVNFKWGTNAHVSADDFDFAAGLNKLMDVLDQKIKKEKDKVQH